MTAGTSFTRPLLSLSRSSKPSMPGMMRSHRSTSYRLLFIASRAD